MWRVLGVSILICLGGGSSAMATAELPAGPKPTATGHRRCGTKELFAHRFQVEAQGVRCSEARRVLSGPCAIHLKRQWSCFSYREDAPFVAWFPTEDLFKRLKYPAILLRRYPCSEAKVTPSLFGLFTKGFPTRRQLLADDVLRCELVAPGDSSPEVEEILGPPDEKETEAGHFFLVYGLGPERDSFFQIDSELLQIELRHGRVSRVSMVQS
jgi:hypothetical protein